MPELQASSLRVCAFHPVHQPKLPPGTADLPYAQYHSHWEAFLHAGTAAARALCTSSANSATEQSHRLSGGLDQHQSSRQRSVQQGQKVETPSLATADGLTSAANVAAPSSVYQRSRLAEFYSRCLARELLLKLNIPSPAVLPRVQSVDLCIYAKDLDGRRYVRLAAHSTTI